MLNQILAEFKQNPALCAEELGERLNVEPSALEGMLQTLVRKGRLLVVDPGAGCSGCPARGGCVVMPGLGKTYLLSGRPATPMSLT